jgi:membrane fusion protein (multidrug efflux system)
MSRATPPHNPSDPNQPVPALPAPGHDTVQHKAGGPPGGHGEDEIPTDLQAPSAAFVIGMVAVFVLLLAVLFAVGYFPSHNEEVQVRKEAAERGAAKPAVQWLHPVEFTGRKDVTLPCDVSAYQQTALYTRANGYLADLCGHDIGSKVKKGDVLAIISTPDVDAQLAQSQATLEQNKANVTKAQADLELAKKTLIRYQDSQRTSPGSVPQVQIDQEQAAYDDALAALKQVQASVTQAEANVQQLRVTAGFEKIIAPFDGTITARNFFVGQLLLPTQVGPGQELFDIQETDKLRVYVNVPQGYANNVRQGQKANLVVRNFPGHPFEGTVSLTAGAVDPTTRTLRVQIDFDNAKGELFAGEYGQIKLPVTNLQPVSIIRSSSLLFNAAGTQVATLVAGDKIHIKDITLGRDLGAELEITTGLTAADRVVVNPGERTPEGAEVKATEAAHDPAPATAPTTKPASMASAGG